MSELNCNAEMLELKDNNIKFYDIFDIEMPMNWNIKDAEYIYYHNA